MADSNIGSLPQAQTLDDDSLLVAEQQGQAVKVTGAQFKEFGRQAVIGQVQGYVDQAEAAADRAVDAVSAVTDMTVEASTLASGESATVTKTTKNGKVNLSFGLPRGEQGETGLTGATGPRGPQGPTGKGLTILGYYDTLDALEAAVPSPNAGDAYGVGLIAPYNIYVFDGVSNEWKDNGPLSGGGGGVLPENVVTADGGASMTFPIDLGDGPHVITFTDEEEPPLTAEDITYEGGTVQDALDDLKSSVSDGKALVASAITDKGVPTAQDATFAQMAENIGQISGGSDTSDATATSFDILAPKTAYTAAGKVDGVIPTLLGQTIVPGTADKTIANGQYLGGTQVIKGDPNLTSSNIKKGVTLFGVEGALESSFKATLTVTADTGAVVTATHTDGTELSALSQTGTVVFELPKEGTWKVTAVRGVAQYNTVTIEVSSQYSASLTAEVHIEYYGVTTPLSNARVSPAAATVGNHVIFGGGSSTSGHSVKYVDAYDNKLVHSNPGNLVEDGRDNAAASTSNHALFAGGIVLNYTRTDKVTAYDEELTQTEPEELSQARSNLAAASIGQYAVFGGGAYKNDSVQNAQSAVVEAYSASLTRSNPSELALPSGSPVAGSNGEYAIFSGSGKTSAYGSSLAKTIATDPGDRYTGAAQAGNYVLFANSNGSIMEAYDLFLTKTVVENLSTQRTNFAMTTLNGFAIIVGGYISSTQSPPVEIYDAYLTHTTINGIRVQYPTAKSIDKYALVAGGRTLSEISSAITTVAVYQYV